MSKTKKPLKTALTHVKGRGFHMNPRTRVVPHRHRDRRRLSSRQVLEFAS